MASNETSPACNREAEEAVIGAALFNEDSKLLIIEKLLSEDFYYIDLRHIFDAIKSLTNEERSVDSVTVIEKLKNNNLLEKIGGSSFIARLSEKGQISAGTPDHIEVIKENSLRRKLNSECNEILEKAVNSELNIKELLDFAEKKIFELAEERDSNDYIRINDLVAETVNSIKEISEGKAELGLKTGFKYLDKKLKGLKKSEMIVLGARPSMGKTAFALNIITGSAFNNKKKPVILFFSLEMAKKQIGERLLSQISKVPLHEIQDGTAFLNKTKRDQLVNAQRKLSDSNIIIDDSANISIYEMKRKARKVYLEFGQLDLVVIDYLQFINSGDLKAESRTQEVTKLSRDIKNFAKELNIPVLILSQLSRSLEQSGVKPRMPRLSDLRDSGAIEQDADVVIFIHREGYYEKEGENQDDTNANIIIEKNRNGPTFEVELYWDKEKTLFEDKEPGSVDYSSFEKKDSAAEAKSSEEVEFSEINKVPF